MARIDPRMRLLGGLPADVDTRTESFSVPGGSGSEAGAAAGAGTVAGAGATGTVPVKIYRPVREYGVLPLLVFFHGGGFVTGSHRGTGGRRHPRTASPHSSRPSGGHPHGMPTPPGSRSPGTARAAISRR